MFIFKTFGLYISFFITLSWLIFFWKPCLLTTPVFLPQSHSTASYRSMFINYFTSFSRGCELKLTTCHVLTYHSEVTVIFLMSVVLEPHSSEEQKNHKLWRKHINDAFITLRILTGMLFGSSVSLKSSSALSRFCLGSEAVQYFPFLLLIFGSHDESLPERLEQMQHTRFPWKSG